MTSRVSSGLPKKVRWFALRRVLGDSMVPTLVPGMVVVGVRPKRIRAGDIVVVWHEGLEKIKRVQKLQFNKVFLVGDNPLASTDSRDFGWLPLDAVLARVLTRGRARWLEESE